MHWGKVEWGDELGFMIILTLDGFGVLLVKMSFLISLNCGSHVDYFLYTLVYLSYLPASPLWKNLVP